MLSLTHRHLIRNRICSTYNVMLRTKVTTQVVGFLKYFVTLCNSCWFMYHDNVNTQCGFINSLGKDITTLAGTIPVPALV